MRRNLTLAALILLLASPSSGAGETSSCSGYFDVSNLTSQQQEQVDEALTHTWFPCDRLDFSHSEREDIVVFVHELHGPLGHNTEGTRIDLDDDLGKRFAPVLIHELGHSVDYLYLTDSDRRQVRRILDARCWWGCDLSRRGGELFAQAFVRGFSDLRPVCCAPGLGRSLLVDRVIWL